MKVNDKYIKELSSEILNIPSPSGYTKEVIARIEKEAKKYDLSCSKTKKGNLLIDVNEQVHDYTIGLAVHVDTLGCMVSAINGDGTIKFTKIGGPILPTLDGEYCTIHTKEGKTYRGTFLSTSPAAHVFKDSATKARNEETMYVRLDEVVYTKDEVEKLSINVGDFISIDPKVEFSDSGFIKSRFLDDKINVGALFGLVDYIKNNKLELKYNLKFIISTYEEVGHGASYIPELDELIAVDMGCVGKDLTCTEEMVSICAKDSSGPYDYDIVSKMMTIAKEGKLDYAVDVYPYYGSDVSAARAGGNDFKGGLIGPGVHASHGMERTHINGVINTVKLLILYLTK